MFRRTITILALVLAALATAAAAAVAAPSMSIYWNKMGSVDKRAEVLKVSGRACERGGSPRALRVVVGKRTEECAYRTPVVGRDLEVVAKLRLLRGTPKRIRKRTFLSAGLRVGGGGGYRLAVFPLQRKVQLFKDLPDGTRSYLAIEKGVEEVVGIDAANVVRLQVFNLKHTRDPDDARVLAFVGGRRVANVLDEAAGPLRGRFSTVSVGSARPAVGAVASFDDLVIRVPRPF